MRAALFHGPHERLTVEEVPRPRPGPREALVRVAACGVCATDLHYLHGTPTFMKPPVILGHEISGTVEEPGGSPSLKKGDRVIVPSVVPCGHCVACGVGRDNICENVRMFGNHVNGGFAELVAAPADYLVKLPASLPLVESSLVTDAISTPFHAVKNRAQVRAGERVAVFGCGGVGINAVQAAVAFGASVVAVDLDPRKLDLARELGAVEALNAKGADVPRTIRKLTGGGVDVALEVVGKPATLQAAFDSVRSGGRLITVGYSEEDWTLRASRVMFREISVIGSLGCRFAEYPTILRMVERGQIKLGPVAGSRLPLEHINEALDGLEKGTVAGRQIVVLGDASPGNP